MLRRPRTVVGTSHHCVVTKLVPHLTFLIVSSHCVPNVVTLQTTCVSSCILIVSSLVVPNVATLQKTRSSPNHVVAVSLDGLPTSQRSFAVGV